VCSVLWRSDRKSYDGRGNLLLPWTELLPRIRDLGYAGVELWDPHAAAADDLPALAAAIRAHGLAVPMLSTYCNFTKSAEHAARSLTDVQAAAARARVLGAPAVRVFTGNHRSADATPEQWTRAADALRTLCDGFTDLAFCCEIHDWNLTDSVPGTLRLLALVDRPNLRLVHHPSHFPDDLAGPLAAFGDRIAHVHATNPDGTLTHGRLDWRAVVAALRAHGYDGWLSVEYFGEDGDARAAAEARALAGLLAT
jgi:sugar phosphate isomerase/epimerase